MVERTSEVETGAVRPGCLGSATQRDMVERRGGGGGRGDLVAWGGGRSESCDSEKVRRESAGQPLESPLRPFLAHLVNGSESSLLTGVRREGKEGLGTRF